MTGKEAITAPLSISESFAKAQPADSCVACGGSLAFSMMVRLYLSGPSSRVLTQAVGCVCILFCPVKGGVSKCVMLFCFSDETKVRVLVSGMYRQLSRFLKIFLKEKRRCYFLKILIFSFLWRREVFADGKGLLPDLARVHVVYDYHFLA